MVPTRTGQADGPPACAVRMVLVLVVRATQVAASPGRAGWRGEGVQLGLKSTGPHLTPLDQTRGDIASAHTPNARSTPCPGPPTHTSRSLPLLCSVDVALCVDPHVLVGHAVQVFWPDDLQWYPGSVAAYDEETLQHTASGPAWTECGMGT